MSAGSHASRDARPLRDLPPAGLHGHRQRPQPPPPRRYIPLFWRVLAVNAALVIGMGMVTVAVMPDRFAHLAPEEIAVLAVALVATLTANTVLLRRALVPLGQLAAMMSRVDPTRRGTRAQVPSAPSEIADLASAFNAMLGDLERERRESTRRALAAQESERLRIAQELHDEVGQTLTAVLLQLAHLGRELTGAPAAQVAATGETAREGLEAVRHISQRLRPEALDDLGLRGALAVLCERVGERGQMRISHEIDERLPLLPDEVELVIYRVAQEALTNAVRHARAQSAALSLHRATKGLTLTVRDDGVGLPRIPGAGRSGGLQGMRERAALVDARLTLGGRRGEGTTVRLEVPLETAAG